MFRTYVNADGLEVLLPNEIFDAIRIEVAHHYPKECGGIFIGKIDSGKRAVIGEISIPKHITNTPTWFHRTSEFLNDRLLEIFNESKGEVIYLGEWHSHPNALPFPSNVDLQTMIKISESQSIRIETPLLLIIGYNRKSFDERFYILSERKLLPYVKQD